ncbi:MAG: cystathionine beta-lyase, partial [Pseudomonadota bacterium]
MNDTFDQAIDKKNTNSLKWEFRVANGEVEAWDGADPVHGDDQILPMWVADMDFLAADPIRKAVEARAAHGVFGYATKSDQYLQAVAGWMARRHNWEI